VCVKTALDHENDAIDGPATVIVPKVPTDSNTQTEAHNGEGEIWNVSPFGLHAYVGVVTKAAAEVGQLAPEMVSVLPLCVKKSRAPAASGTAAECCRLAAVTVFAGLAALLEMLVTGNADAPARVDARLHDTGYVEEVQPVFVFSSL